MSSTINISALVRDILRVNVYKVVVSTKDFTNFTTGDGKVRRPTNKFLVFRKNFIKILTGAGISWASEMRKVTSVAQAYWKNADPEQKKPFVDIANEVKTNHITAHPDYTYRPNKKKNEFREYHYPCDKQQRGRNTKKDNTATPNKTTTEIIPPEANTINVYSNTPSLEDESPFSLENSSPGDTVIDESNQFIPGFNDETYGSEKNPSSFQVFMPASHFTSGLNDLFGYPLNLEDSQWFGYDFFSTYQETGDGQFFIEPLIDPKSQENREFKSSIFY